MPKNKANSNPLAERKTQLEELLARTRNSIGVDATFTSQELATAMGIKQHRAVVLIKNWMKEGDARYVGRLHTVRRMDGVYSTVPTYQFTDEGFKKLKKNKLKWLI